MQKQHVMHVNLMWTVWALDALNVRSAVPLSRREATCQTIHSFADKCFPKVTSYAQSFDVLSTSLAIFHI